MKTLQYLIVLSALLLGSCGIFSKKDDKEENRLRGTELKAAIMGDLDWRGSDIYKAKMREMEGVVLVEDGRQLCRVEGTDLDIVIISREPSYKEDAIDKTAYYCFRCERYYIRYESKGKNIDAIFGPFGLRR
ncbi:MAG: hypothetical protein A2W23_01655 [Planctomycetes bacterium RBG_16_43_13]|nr:MAG: hypothetical protein A2W23_01655 [Planctomycetes bacterium RBG_16_43_13]